MKNKQKIKLAIIGSRSFNNYIFAKNKILKIIDEYNIIPNKIISGGAYGSDKIAEMFANDYNIPIEIILPDWKIGKLAGFIRNTKIIDECDYIIAFWDGCSKGTLDSINHAKKTNKKLFVINISTELINEGVRLNDDETYEFDFNLDNKND